MKTPGVRFLLASQKDASEDSASDPGKSVPAEPDPKAAVDTAGSKSVSESSDQQPAADKQPAADEQPKSSEQPPSSQSDETQSLTPQELDRNEQLRRMIEQMQRRRAGANSDTATAEPAPIHIRVTPQGEIQLESDDTEALDLFEQMLEEMAPPRRDWHVFELKYPTTWAY